MFIFLLNLFMALFPFVFTIYRKLPVMYGTLCGDQVPAESPKLEPRDRVSDTKNPDTEQDESLSPQAITFPGHEHNLGSASIQTQSTPTPYFLEEVAHMHTSLQGVFVLPMAEASLEAQEPQPRADGSPTVSACRPVVAAIVLTSMPQKQPQVWSA